MSNRTEGTSWRAALTAALLLATGVAMGIVIDRHWLSPSDVYATPLTAEAIADRLDLSVTEAEKLQSLLDSLHGEILAVMQQDPDALGAAVQSAKVRIEAALPPESRGDFHAWMKEHQDRVINHMHGVMKHEIEHAGPGGGEHAKARGGEHKEDLHHPPGG
jgi:hypothetical protein